MVLKDKLFIIPLATEHGVKAYIYPVHNTRNLTKRDMKLNQYSPDKIVIDPQSFKVYIDGEEITCEASDTLPLVQRYYLY